MERQGDKGEFAQTYDNNMYDLQMFGINFSPVKIELSHWGLSKKSTTNILDFVFSIYDPMLPYRRLFQSNTKSCLKGSRST